MKKDHKRAFGLVFWVLTGETQFKGKSEAKRGALHVHARRQFQKPFSSNSSDSHAISSPFQVFIVSMKDPRSKPK